MARSGSSAGTVVRWDDGTGGVIEVTDPPEECWADTAVVVGGPLRAGQVVTVDWTEPGDHGRPLRAVRVRRRDDMGATPGG